MQKLSMQQQQQTKMMFSKNEVEHKDKYEDKRKDKRKENHKDKNTHKGEHKNTHKAEPKNNHPKIELLIYNCPFEKTYTTNTGALIRFTTKQSSKGKLYKLIERCQSKKDADDILTKNDVCLNSMLEKEDQVNSKFIFNISNTTIVEEKPMFYILEYYYYGIVSFPSEIHKLSFSKKFANTTDNTNNITQFLMLYPEILFPGDLESPTIIDDYIERYIPSYNASLNVNSTQNTAVAQNHSTQHHTTQNHSTQHKSTQNHSTQHSTTQNAAFKYMSYNETINFKINHSIIQLGIKQEDYINFSPKQFLEYLEHIYSVQTSEKKDLIQQYQEQIKIIDID